MGVSKTGGVCYCKQKPWSTRVWNTDDFHVCGVPEVRVSLLLHGKCQSCIHMISWEGGGWAMSQLASHLSATLQSTCWKVYRKLTCWCWRADLWWPFTGVQLSPVHFDSIPSCAYIYKQELLFLEGKGQESQATEFREFPFNYGMTDNVAPSCPGNLALRKDSHSSSQDTICNNVWADGNC